MAALKVGDVVKYSRNWLRSIGCYTGELPFARGTIVAFKPIGSLVLADVEWNTEQAPSRVNVVNLCLAAKSEVEL